jgi:hypothetical protein
MSRINKLFVLALSFALVAAALALVPSNRISAAPSGAPVTVVNTPLPVTAAQSGVWNVGVIGTPGVNVSNTATSPVLARNVDAGTLTHVGQSASNLVNLVTTSTIFANEGYRRIFADGSAATNFTTPRGQALVVTDVYFRCGGATPGSQIFFDLEPLVAPNTGGVTMFETVSTTDSSGNAHAEQHLTTGLAITGTFSEPLTTHVQCGFWDVRVYGYLVPNT